MTNPNICCCCGEEHGLDDMHDIKIKSNSHVKWQPKLFYLFDNKK